MQEEKNTKGKSYKYISIIGVFAIVFSLIAISSSSGTTTYLNGVIWKVINGNTIVQNNTVLNVNIGENASTANKFNVHGETSLDGSLMINNKTSLESYVYLNPLTGGAIDTGFYTHKGAIHSLFTLYNDGLNILDITGETSTFTYDVNTANLYVNGYLFVNGVSHFYDNVTFDGVVTFDGDVNFNGGVDYSGKDMGFVPKGSIMLWGGSSTCFDNNGWLSNGSRWHICDGSFGTVDLRSKFVMGANVSVKGTPYHIGNKSGNTSQRLVVVNLPSHNHTLNGVIGVIKTITTTTQGVSTSTIPTVIKTLSTTTLSVTDKTGSGTSFNILPPYYNLAYIQFMGY